MYKLYKITTTESDGVYFGITKVQLSTRFSQHKGCALRGKKTKLYCAMRKYGVSTFRIECLKEFQSMEEACHAEQEIIKISTCRLYNLAKGGQTGYSMTTDPRYGEWKHNLSCSRKGRKPALGMKHSEANRKFFSLCSKKRWDAEGKYPNGVVSMSFANAEKFFGISKTHYYRMRRMLNEHA